MRKRDRVAHALHGKLLKSLHRTGSLIYNPHYAYVIKGLDLDRTAYKDSYSFLVNVQVFFSDKPFMSLNYAHRLSNRSAGPELGDLFCGTFDEVAEQCLATINRLGLLEQLQRPYTLADFLHEHCARIDPANSINYELTEAACAAALVGDFARAEHYLDAVAEMHGEELDRNVTIPDYDVIRFAEAAAYRAALSRGTTDLVSLIVQCATRNARKLGFEPVGPAATPAVLPVTHPPATPT